MPRAKMTPEEKEAAKQKRKLEKELEKQNTLAAAVQEEAEWQTKKAEVFLTCIVKLASLYDELNEYMDDDNHSSAMDEINPISIEYDRNNVLNTNVAIYDIETSKIWSDGFSFNYQDFTRKKATKVDEFIELIDEYFRKYAEEEQKKHQAAMERAALKTSALAKLSEAEKAALGICPNYNISLY